MNAGDNAFDTAHVYGDTIERALDNWLRRVDARSEVVIIAKGGHPPDCAPEQIAPQLEQTLDRLGIDT